MDSCFCYDWNDWAHMWMMKGNTHKNYLNHMNDSNKGEKS